MRSNGPSLSDKRFRRFQVQGYRGYTRMQLSNYQLGIRSAYFLCVSIVILGVILENIGILSIAMTISFLGVVLPWHPFDYLYNYAIRFVFRLPPIPRRTNQTRFACGMAFIFLAAAIICFAINYTTVGYILTGTVIALATLVTTTDICIPSMIFNTCILREGPVFNKSASHE